MFNKKGIQRFLSLSVILTMIISVCFGILPSVPLKAAAKPALNKTSANVLIGKSVKLKLKKKVGKAKINWKSKNKKIAKVNKNGKVTGVKKGNTKITAAVSVKGKKYRLNSKIKVIQKAKSFRITYSNGKTASPVQLKTGQQLKLTAKMTSPKSSNDFITSWKSNNGNAVSVNKNGKITALNPGEATITATAFGKSKASIAVNVTQNGIILSAPPHKESPSPTPTFDPGKKEFLYSTDFEEALDGFGARGNGRAVRVDTAAQSGKYSLHVSGRTNPWHGTQMNATNLLKTGNKYYVRSYVKQDTGSVQTLKISLQCDFQDGSGSTYPKVAELECQSGEWTLVEGYVDMLESPSQTQLYFEMPSNATADFYVDNISVWWDSEVVIVPLETAPPLSGKLKEAYQGLFTIGTAVTGRQLTNANDVNMLNHVVEQYDSITMENEMKPSAILGNRATFEDNSFDRSTLPESYKETTVPKLNFSTVDQCLAAAQSKGLKMRGHTLVWHSQTPSWFFKVDYSDSQPLVSKEVMDARMEFYIKSVMTHVQTKYPDIVYAWDVCNEVFTNDGSNSYDTALRGSNPGAAGESSNWYSIYQSDEFIINAFQYASEVKDENVSLFYNDYNEYMPSKTDNIVTLATKLYEKGTIDGIGMQSHIDLTYPSAEEVKEAIDKFAAIGDGALEIQLTELDVTLNFFGGTSGTFEKQTAYYRDLMHMLVKAKRDEHINITNVTLWGFYDEMSWRREFTPLLLNYTRGIGFTEKGAFKEVLNAPTLAE